MDGRGRFSDNIFVERLWRSLKYEDVYLKAYQGEARYRIATYFEFYNHERLPQALGYRTPRQVFDEALQVAKPRRERKPGGAERAGAAQ
jgi:putative transposase